MRLGISLAIMAAAVAVWLYGAWHSPLLDRSLAAERAFVASQANQTGRDTAAERALAEAYWRRYPDVAADPLFGRHGKLGVSGARAHYDRHGRREGRLWAR